MKWPPNIPLIQRHQYCAYHDKGRGAFYHRMERIKAIWPKEYAWHRWNERRLKSLCTHHWVTWLGPGGSAKTTDAAVFAIEYWLQAPDRTAVIVCSTTMKMLRMRIWGQVARFHQMLPQGLGPVGELLDSDTRIRWRKGDNMNGIIGIAVEEGPVDEVINNLIGIHTERVLLILDEAQGVREAIMGATKNMAKNPRFDALLIGNPDDFNNPLVRESEPLGGWDSVIRGETEEWETRGGPVKGNGITLFFDGRKSPSDDSPEERKRLHWLINRDWISNHLKSVGGNENDPSFWSQCIGWPPAMGIESTVLDAAIIEKFHCRENAIWTHGFVRCASLDPAFEGGDQKILRFGRRGEVSDEHGRHWVVQLDEWLDVPINADIKEPIHYQIMTFCRAACRLKNIGPEEFALDSSGEGGGLKAIFDTEWGPVTGVEFGGKPSDRPVNDFSAPGDEPRKCSEVYDRRATELNMAVRTFAMGNGLRGLTKESEDQFCKRLTFFKNRKYIVETKREMKKRIQRSPDNADADAILVEHCRQKGAVASVGQAVEKVSQDWSREVKKTNNDFDSNNYLEGSEYRDEIYSVM